MTIKTAMDMGNTHYPVNIDEMRNLLIASNNKRVTLAASVAADDLAITVSGSLTDWPASGAVTLDVATSPTLTSSEICYYDGIAGQTITLVDRGVDGTGAKDFAAGSRVEMRPVARHHNVLAEAIIATQTAVDSKLSLSDLPGVFLPRDFNASGSLVTTTGSISAGFSQLSVADGSTFQAGQGVYIAGAGASGAAFVTTISSIAGNEIVVAATASTTVTNALVQHDDSAAINAVMAAAVSAGGGEILFSPGFYRCNGAFTSAGSILAPPYIPVTDGTPVAIKLKAIGPPPWFSFDGPHPNTGVIFQTDKVKIDANSSLFSTAPFVAGTDWSLCSNIVLYIDGIQFRTYDNPNISALDLAMAGGVWLDNIWIDTGITLMDGAEPMNGTFGLRMPRANTPTGFSYVDRAWIQYYQTGAILAEAQGVANVLALRCKTAYEMNHNFAPFRATLNTWQCPTIAAFNDSAYLDWSIHMENGPDGFWYSPITGRHFFDSGDLVHGIVKYSSIRSATGADVPLSNTGCTAVVFTDLRA